MRWRSGSSPPSTPKTTSPGGALSSTSSGAGTGDYETARLSDGASVAAEIEATGRRAVLIEADLSDVVTPGRPFDETESTLGPVSVLAHNASGWQKDSFAPAVGHIDPDVRVLPGDVGLFGSEQMEVPLAVVDRLS